MTTRHQSQDLGVTPLVKRERPWLYPYNRRLRHLHGISIRNVSLSPSQGRPRANTVDDAALPASLRSPAKALAQQERKQLEHSRSITDLKAIAESEDGAVNRGRETAVGDNEASPGKKPPLRKLRRRSTIEWQNGGSDFRQKKLEDAIAASMADIFFSLHVPGYEDPVYISETIGKTTNPDFRFFDLKESGPAVSRLEDLVVKVWAKSEKMDDYQYLVEMNLNLRSLQFIGKTIEGFPQALPQNCILFHMKDGVYTTFLDNFTGEPSATATAPTRTGSITQVLPSSSYDALMRLSTLDECIQDALQTRATLEKEINRILEDNGEPIHTVCNVSFQRNALDSLNDAINIERKRLVAAKRRRDELQTRLKHRTAYIEAGFRDISEGDSVMRVLTADIFTMREKLSSVTEETLGQRRRICEDLLSIFPINPLPNKTLHFSIRDIPLANSTFEDSSDEATSAALGYVALILDRLQYYLSVPLPYPLTPRGSTSTIIDPISSIAAGMGKDGRTYPLFGGRGGSSARSRFEFGVFLLNKNVEVLSETLGLKIVDPRMTLGNLKYALYVATAGKGEIPTRKAGGIRGFLRTGGSGSVASSRRDSMDSEGSGSGGGGNEGKGLMLPPSRPMNQFSGTGAEGKNGPLIGNGKMKLGYGQVGAGIAKGSGLRNVS